MGIKARLRPLALRARDRLDATFGLVEPPPPPPQFPTALPRPVPEGWSEDQLRAVLDSFAIDNNEPMHGYVDDAFWRFLHTWGCVAGETGRALELGSNPYFITYLVDEHTALDVTLAN